jgi:hypothetical protein
MNWKVARMWILYLLFFIIELLSLLNLFPLINETPVYLICIIISLSKFAVIFVLLFGSITLDSTIFELGFNLHKIHSIVTPIAGIIALPMRLSLTEPSVARSEMSLLFMYFLWTILPNVICFFGNKKARREIRILEKIRAKDNRSSVFVEELKSTPLIEANNPKNVAISQTRYEQVQVTPMSHPFYEPS